jgi:hypothetical protein
LSLFLTPLPQPPHTIASTLADAEHEHRVGTNSIGNVNFIHTFKRERADFYQNTKEVTCSRNRVNSNEWAAKRKEKQSRTLQHKQLLHIIRATF